MRDVVRTYQFGPFEFAPSLQALRGPRQQVSLTPSLTRLLMLFVTQPDGLVTREDIAAALWEDHRVADTTSRINTSIRRLREQLDASGEPASAGNEAWIATVVGSGYRLTVPVTTAGEDADRRAANAQPVAAIRPSQQAAAGPRLEWPRLALIGCMIFVLLAIVAWFLRHSGRKTETASAKALSQPLIARLFPVTHNEIEETITAQSISPDGNLVAYSDPSGVLLESTDGRTLSRLVSPPGLEVHRISWFPDQKHLLLSGVEHGAERFRAWAVSVNGESPKILLEDAASSTVSPNGRQVAFLRAARSEVWVAGTDGQNARRLISGSPVETFRALVWSPDSARLIVDRETSTPLPASEPASGVQGGPLDVLQVQHRWSYESRNAQTGALLAERDNVSFDSAVLFSDGRMVFPLNPPGEKSKLGMFWTDLATGSILFPQSPSPMPEPLNIDNARQAEDLSASADGARISGIIDRSNAMVYVAQTRSSSAARAPALLDVVRLTKHTATSYPTSWAPDGSQVVFDNGDAGRLVIAEQPIAGGPVRELTSGERDAQGQFSPDGKWILFLHFVGDSERIQSIERIPAGGGEAVQLNVPGEIEEFHCPVSSAGSCVLRETSGKKELVYYALDPIRGRGAELAATPWEPNVLGDWSVSPDGSTVVMADHDPAHPGIQLIPLAPRSEDSVAPFTPITEIQIPGFGVVLEPTWLTNGDGFLVETHTAKGYALVHCDRQGRATLLRESPELIWAVPSRDGKKLAFPQHAPSRNVWVAFTHIDDLR